jgi:pimeloyl-ACP methyl ester carboxylesterase
MSETVQFLKLSTGRNLAFEEFGSPNGFPIFFFHGWPSSRLHAKSCDEVAKKIGIRIIGIDRPGYGSSDYYNERELLDWPDDVIALADELKVDKFSVLGVSGGGPYSLACVYKIPQRLISAGIVVGLGPVKPELLERIAFFNWLGWRFYKYSKLYRDFASWFSLISARYFSWIYKFSTMEKTDSELLKNKQIFKNYRLDLLNAFRQGIRGASKDLELYTKDWGFDLQKIQTKVFLFYGEKDKNVSVKMGKFLESQLPNVQAKYYSDEGHFIMRSHTEEILLSLLPK